MGENQVFYKDMKAKNVGIFGDLKQSGQIWWRPKPVLPKPGIMFFFNRGNYPKMAFVGASRRWIGQNQERVCHSHGGYVQCLLECAVLRIPSGKHTKNYGKSPFLIGKINYKWQFSIVMLVCLRVSNSSIAKMKSSKHLAAWELSRWHP